MSGKKSVVKARENVLVQSASGKVPVKVSGKAPGAHCNKGSQDFEESKCFEGPKSSEKTKGSEGPQSSVVSSQKEAYLILADGTVFKGLSIGASGSVIGETVFTTGMTGYLETLTDPSYYGQIVTQTFPLIGNYGLIPSDFESRKSWVRGYIVRELCQKPSNFRSSGDLDSFLKAQGIVGICGIDTRALTKKLRDVGVMNGMIVSGKAAHDFTSRPQKVPAADFLEKIKAYTITEAVKAVNIKEGKASLETSHIRARCEYPSSRVFVENSVSSPLANDLPLPLGGTQQDCLPPKPPYSSQETSKTAPAKRVVLFDFGAKANIQRELEKRGLLVSVVPFDTTAEEVLSLKPDGIMLSNGPGDPAENTGLIEEIRKLCEWNKSLVEAGAEGKCDEACQTRGKLIPIFGICLGHQMLALARGAKTSKLKYGHRGGNHPVKDTSSGRVYITSQNHGYAVEASSLPACARLSFVNVNDDTCEGLDYTDIPAFSVQFHPEACGGPHDTNFLFDKFLEMLG